MSGISSCFTDLGNAPPSIFRSWQIVKIDKWQHQHWVTSVPQPSSAVNYCSSFFAEIIKLEEFQLSRPRLWVTFCWGSLSRLSMQIPLSSWWMKIYSYPALTDGDSSHFWLLLAGKIMNLLDGNLPNTDLSEVNDRFIVLYLGNAPPKTGFKETKIHRQITNQFLVSSKERTSFCKWCLSRGKLKVE